MPYKHGAKGKSQTGVYESVSMPKAGKVKKSSNPSKKVSGGGKKGKMTQGY